MPLPTYYSRDKYNKLKFKFKGCEKISNNASEAYQDMFVLTMLDGKENGTYVEIGSGHPFIGNNTALLEIGYGWTGVSIEMQENLASEFSEHRKNNVAHGDATEIDYDVLFEEMNLGPDIDYLQVDCEPPYVTFEALKKIPLDKYRFAVITFEHDAYNHVNDKSTKNKSIQEKCRKYLESYGYKLVVNNVSVEDYEHSFEDWWVHPELVDSSIIEKMTIVNDSPKMSEDYMLESTKVWGGVPVIC